MSSAAIEEGVNIEEAMLLSDFAKTLASKPSYQTVWAWVNVGIKSRSGKIVKLETVPLTRGEGTSKTAYHRFLKKLAD